LGGQAKFNVRLSHIELGYISFAWLNQGIRHQLKLPSDQSHRLQHVHNEMGNNDLRYTYTHFEVDGKRGTYFYYILKCCILRESLARASHLMIIGEPVLKNRQKTHFPNSHKTQNLHRSKHSFSFSFFLLRIRYVFFSQRAAP